MKKRAVVGRLVARAGAVLLSLAALAPAAQAQTRENPKLRYSFASVGLVPGQSVRVSLVNLTEPPDPEAPPNPAIDPCWRVFLVNTEGRVVVDSGDIELPPGRTRTFTVDRRKLDVASEDRTGRVQVRVVVVVENDNASLAPPEPEKLRPAVEVMLTATGHTMFGLSDPPEPERF